MKLFFTVGATVEEPSDLRYLYENHDNFAVLPAFYVLHGPMYCMSSSMFEENLPNFQLDPTKVIYSVHCSFERCLMDS